jgi:threonine/homoserine/homoserine lactone efflux protein
VIAGLDPATVLTFLGAGVLLNLTPGADVMFASASGIDGGPCVGVAAVAGISLGAFVHTGLSAAGLAAGLAGQTLTRRTRWLNRVSAVVFASLAARLLLD